MVTPTLRLALVLVPVVLLPACTSWRPVELPAPMSTEWAVRGVLRVSTEEGSRLRGDSAWMTGDTIRLRSALRPQAVIPRAAIARLERREFDGNRTVGLGIGLLILGIISAISVNDALSGGILFGGGGL